MPIGVLQVLDDLAREHDWLAPCDQVAAALHDDVADDLLAIAELLNQVSQEALKVHLQVNHVLLEQQGHHFDRGERDLEVDVRDELVDEAQEGRRHLLIESLLCAHIPYQLH